LSDAVVVGAGPNGLAAAAALAREGVSVRVLEAAATIGGGTRTSELTLPGVLHDECSAVHPMAVGSPFLRSLELERHGLEWRWPEVDLAHPLDDGSAGAMFRSMDATADALGEGGASWRSVFGKRSESFETLSDDLMQPVLRVPDHPLRLLRFGLAAGMPASVVARRLRTPQAKALFAGAAAHAIAPLTRPMSASVGTALICACHTWGWAVAHRGSRSITDALASYVTDHGGVIETGIAVTSLDELGTPDTVMLDLSPSGVASVAGDRLPSRIRRAYERYRRGPAAYKVDLAVEGGVPWTNAACRRAGTVHAAGPVEEIVAAERDVNAGRMPERPFVLVGQQYLADPERSNGNVHPVWSYAHVPNGYEGDLTDAVIGQIERFAPGLRDRIVGTAVRTPAEFDAYNANYVGGDIITGSNGPVQVVLRPRIALDPYATGIPGVFICSAATPPGAGVHGMNGYNAARSALRHLERAG